MFGVNLETTARPHYEKTYSSISDAGFALAK